MRIADAAGSPGSRQIRSSSVKVLVVHERKASPCPIAGVLLGFGFECLKLDANCVR